MHNSDLFNTTLLESDEEVDQINKKFYGRYNYPWPPLILPVYPADISALFLNQDIGCWSHDRIPAKAKIWVAGCGTNQALLTALKFPQAEVFATDISTQSLDVCRRNADHIGVSNLQFEEKSLNEVEYEEAFDYIICTGVVHHNARPETTLQKISGALKKNGILEFMVYNYYHRLLTTACQKAIRNFYDAGSSLDLEQELTLIRSLIADFQYDNLMGQLLKPYAKKHEAEMTDNLVQPVEYSYTIESLSKLADSCNLELLLHCQNQFDVSNNAFTWNMKFKNGYLADRYYSLPDARRWQISNLLMFNDSPMLWFYLQRKDSSFERKPERQVCEEFLETRFKKNSFLQSNYVLNTEGNYRMSNRSMRYPAENGLTDPMVREVYKNISPDRTMKDVFNQCNLEPDFYRVNAVRIKLTTSGYSYLLADHTNV